VFVRANSATRFRVPVAAFFRWWYTRFCARNTDFPERCQTWFIQQSAAQNATIPAATPICIYWRS
jgi:hypothetical protein